MPSLFIATCKEWPTLPANLQPLVQQLQQRGITVKVAPWQQAQEADVVWTSCVWDYSTQVADFLRWLEQLEQQGITTVNPISLMRWNMRKTYLQDLMQSGVEVIPTQYFQHLTIEQLREWGERQQTSHFVLKPAIGQSGKGVSKGSLDALPDLTPYSQDVIVQPYISAIEQYGETSMVFFQGKFSHAVKRQPPQGEWRANSAYGVQVFATQPSQVALQAAQKVVDYVSMLAFEGDEVSLGHSKTPPAYARVDGIDALDEGTFLLNECELIEPALYWHTSDKAADRFVQVLYDIFASR